MTISLAIDTSTSRTVVGLLDGEKVLFEKYSEGATDHGRAVVVGMGPGPFTGLRVGIAFARTFALSRGIPVIGVCSLDAIETGKSDYTVAIDARRKEIYWARYEGGKRVEGPSVNKPGEVSDFIIDLYPNVISLIKLAAEQSVSEPFYLRRPDAVPTAERS
jgi:tRNA threonylcarbamoyl adenosine modification protein YeaZ